MEPKRIENLDGFKNMRIVDNFYQTSSFFSMPTIEISTVDENGFTNTILKYGVKRLCSMGKRKQSNIINGKRN